MFDTFFFNPLSFDGALELIGKCDGTKEQKHEFYKRWLYGFYRNADLYYRSRYYCHQRVIERYAESLGIAVDDPAYLEVCDECGLENHFNDVQKYSKILKDLVRREAPEIYEFHREFYTLRDILSEHYQEILLEVALQTRIDCLDETWFNLTINNDPKELNRLRWMPYREYLQTTHWKRVRSAMLLIKSAICECQRCRGEESWYSNEDELHVHHKTYKNRGNERYADLELVCRFEHDRIHQKIETPTEYHPSNELPF